MAVVKDVKKGSIVKLNNEYCVVLDYTHVKMGRGGAIMRVKTKNLRTEAVIETTFSPDANIEFVRVSEKPMQYLYKEGDLYYFMDQTSYEQFSIPKNMLKDALKYLKEEMVLHIIRVDEEIIGVKMPTFCELKIVNTEPPMKGARISGGLKPAQLETGVSIQVPLFLNVGDIIKIDTRTDEYIERVQV